jgi:hypothetical protein
MTKKPVRNPEKNHYHVNGKKYKELIGSRAQVMHGNAFKTKAGLTAKDLKYNKSGKIVSKKKSVTAKKENRLKKYGYVPLGKGKFGVKKI